MYLGKAKHGYCRLTSGTSGPVTVHAINLYNTANGVKLLKQGPTILGSKIKLEVLAILAARILTAESHDQVKQSSDGPSIPMLG